MPFPTENTSGKIMYPAIARGIEKMDDACRKPESALVTIHSSFQGQT